MKITTALQLFKLPVTGLVPETSTTAPSSPADGQLWIDNSVSPRLFKVWDGAAWVVTNIYAGTTAGSYAAGNDARITGAVQSSTKGVANGVASLDATVKVPYAQIPVGTAASTIAAGDDARITGAQQASAKNAANGYAGLDAGTKLSFSQVPTAASGAATANTVVIATDSRLNDQRVPTDGSVTGGPSGAGVKIAVNTITDVNVAAANKDGAVGVASLRTLGYGALQAAPGNSRLDQFAAPTSSVSMNSQRLTSLAPSQTATDAVNRAELDAARQGYAGTKDPVRVAATTNINVATPGAAIDGVTLAVGDRVLLTAQTTALQNGIYTFNGSAAALTRDVDADAGGEIKDGTTVAVGEGTGQGSVYIQTAAVGTNAPGAGVAETWVVFTTQATYIGTANRITVTGTAIDIAGTYVGQTSITTVGTITSGTWQGTAVGVAYGGTGANTAPLARTALGVSQVGFAATLGAITAGTPLVVTHNLGTQDVIAQVRDASTNEYLFMDVINASTNTVTITSGVAFAASAVRIVVLPVA